jgi:hypothetical protein
MGDNLVIIGLNYLVVSLLDVTVMSNSIFGKPFYDMVEALFVVGELFRHQPIGIRILPKSHKIKSERVSFPPKNPQHLSCYL